MKEKPRRKEAIRDLVELRLPLNEAIDALHNFPWDSEEEVYFLSRKEVLQLLHLYQDQKLTAEECQQWADALEGREDLGYEVDFEETLKESLFEIANPELFGDFADIAHRWVEVFSKIGSDDQQL